MNKKGFLMFAGLCAVLCGMVIGINRHAGRVTNILERMPFTTGQQNNCLGGDEASGMVLVGTYNNELIAFAPDGTRRWSVQGRGPFSQLVVRPDSRTLYAGNEDNNLYVLHLDTGELLLTINVERRIFNIDVTEDEGEILISAGTGTSRQNILLYNADGEQKSNFSYNIRMKGALYSSDGEGIFLADNQGELIRIDRQGRETNRVSLQYELVDLKRIEGNRLLTLDKAGVYYVLDEDLRILRRGSPAESFAVTGRAVGSDTEGNYIVVGTEERFLYLFDENNRQIYTTRLDNSITNFMSVGEAIYFTGLGDFVFRFSSTGLAGVGIMQGLKPVLGGLAVVFAAVGAVFLLLGIGRTRLVIIRAGRLLNQHKIAYILLIPTFVLLIAFNYSSVFIALTRAFTDWSWDRNTWGTMHFVGLDNFRLMITEGYFLTGIKNMFIIMAAGVLKTMTFPLLTAWLIFSMKFDLQKTVFRLLFVLPMVVPGVVGALMWKQIYDPTIGLLNQLLGRMGLENLQQVWLGDEKWALWSILFVGFPFVGVLPFLVFYGGLMDIDIGILESARIDGANRGKIFFRIQLPILMAQVKVLLILAFINSVQDFSGIYLLTGGGPGTSTYVPGLELYFNTTQFGRFGYACALGLVLFVFTMIGTLLNMKIKTNSD
ncbi:MAG: ABC transporter permease subunit [Spirochaetaceae bacterium]|jgi:ABC-type sugar transport system permease subunit/outer membrane protein assembly factor BamB|nr:ABC transporter permease subunit [Spirochaetaceae bacterium]